MAFLKAQNRKKVEPIGERLLEDALVKYKAAKREPLPHQTYLTSKDLGTMTKVRNQDVLLFREFMERLNSLLPEGYKVQRVKDIYYYIGLGQLDSLDVVKTLISYLQERRMKAKHARSLKMTFQVGNRPGILAAITPEIADLNLNIIRFDPNVEGRMANPELQIRIYNGDINRLQLRNIISALRGVADIKDDYLS